MKKVAGNLIRRIKFWLPNNIKQSFVKHGVVLFAIIVIWEVVEDIVIPCVFYLLGSNIDEAFYAAIPITWVLCLHPFAVPIAFSAWLFLTRNKDDSNSEINCEDHNEL